MADIYLNDILITTTTSSNTTYYTNNTILINANVGNNTLKFVEVGNYTKARYGIGIVIDEISLYLI